MSWIWIKGLTQEQLDKIEKDSLEDEREANDSEQQEQAIKDKLERIKNYLDGTKY